MNEINEIKNICRQIEELKNENKALRSMLNVCNVELETVHNICNNATDMDGYMQILDDMQERGFYYGGIR